MHKRFSLKKEEFTDEQGIFLMNVRFPILAAVSGKSLVSCVFWENNNKDARELILEWSSKRTTHRRAIHNNRYQLDRALGHKVWSVDVVECLLWGGLRWWVSVLVALIWFLAFALRFSF